ncbi:murein L,D-transpeptidase catalytic domain family protein [Flavobacterium xanthum]|uniref:L,D-transpeptidase catalytic domain n=1 Tax=Flavobacterium xanthum TaxID=69322 RepID=A0A1M6X1Q5_9FLAO|nr:murein L,D-transpeptidase catalytic domain family protein [Flavobacterium xanthum]SHK99854.1 L,D-transpeptidase catalytic domain [Flavobacterium xanthum]
MKKKLTILLLCSFHFIVAQGNQEIVKKAYEIQTKWGFKAKNKNIITLIDFSKSIEEARLYVIDLKNSKILLESNVDHGSGSGTGLKPTLFSNTEGSNATSLGCYVTLQTYKGTWGYSLRLNGLENDKNSNALKRNIVVHSSKRMYSKFSLGCFSVPDKNAIMLIDLIKNGSLVYAYQ